MMTEAKPQTVHAAFRQAAARWPERPFLAVLPETAERYGIEAGEITYAAAAETVERLSVGWAKAGFGRGHRVALLTENRPSYFLTWFALNRLGISVVPINPDLRSAELEYLIGHSEIAAAVVLPERMDDIRAAAEVAGRSVAVVAPGEAPERAPFDPPRPGTPDVDTECGLLYTSGTTGRPKGCVLPNEYFLEAGRWYAETGGLIALQEGVERMITPLPVFHMNAMAYSAMAMLMTGGCLIAVDRFHPKSWWANVRDSGATVLHYLGVMPAMLMAAPADPSDRAHTVRFGFGAGVPRDLQAPFEARFGFPLIEAWAMTETGAGAVIAATDEPRHVGTNCFGRAPASMATRIVAEDGTEAAIDQPGELLVRRAGPEPRFGFFREYLKDPEASAEAWRDGWFHTGDVVRRGPDGSFHFVDRKKNVIRRSGENIAAVEVEAVLLRHPAVKAAAVAATPDPVRGDEVFALIVPHDKPVDAQAAAGLADDIVAHCLGRLAYYKAPGWIAFAEALPLTSTQKIQRGELKTAVAERMAAGDVLDTRALKKRTA
ncbi:ATP-dependent acyl-CoA ligase [Prosthecomicrobium hirschii]|nr:ATP-dependent acyl-CoA ligase [Prosthecomicrobium hirschii]